MAVTKKSWWFSPETPYYNTLLIFILTTLFYFVGAELRLIDQLSLFWPLNAVMAGVFFRNPYIARPGNYLICYLSMLLFDGFTTHWGIASLVINLSNMVFIITVTHLLLLTDSTTDTAERPLNALRFFIFCLLASLLCALVGALGSATEDNINFPAMYADWFSEEFSTGILILPFLLTVRWPKRWPVFSLQHIWPLVMVAVSLVITVTIGGPGSLAFPLPALIWCAVRYPLPITCLITLLTGILEIVLVAYGLASVGSHLRVVLNELVSTRLGIATIAICPIIVALSVASINSLLQQISRRADFDFLTGAYSRSGLFECLKRRQQEYGSEQAPVSVIMMDIDHFKAINDTWGHECGDEVLREFVRHVTQLVNGRGMVTRMGGEEFGIICMEQSLEDTVQLAEEIRVAVARMQITWHDDTLSLTVSLGIDGDPDPERDTVEIIVHLLLQADKHLYHAKRQGRNRLSSPLHSPISVPKGHPEERLQ